MIGKGMRLGKFTQDIPQLTEFLAENPVFIKYALKVNKSTNKGLTRFQKFLHESAFPEESAHQSKKSKSHSLGGLKDSDKNHKND